MVPIGRLRELERDVGSLLDQGLVDKAVHEAYLLEFKYQVPEQLPDARSIIVVAVPQPKMRIHFTYDGKDVATIVPPTYANAWTPTGNPRMRAAVEEIHEGVRSGLAAGLVVHGGHGLTYDNIQPVAAIVGFTEFNIGHTIIARSVFVGLRHAVAEMKHLIDRAAAEQAVVNTAKGLQDTALRNDVALDPAIRQERIKTVEQPLQGVGHRLFIAVVERRHPHFFFGRLGSLGVPGEDGALGIEFH